MNIFKRLFRRKAPSEVEGGVTLALLRSIPRDLSREQVETIAREAWTDRFGENDDGEGFVDSGADGKFILSPYGNAILFAEFGRGETEFDKPDGLNESEAALWDKYASSILINIVYAYDADTSRLYSLLGHLALKAIDSNTLGLIRLPDRSFYPIDDALKAQLLNSASSLFATADP